MSPAAAEVEEAAVDLELFDEEWHPLVQALSAAAGVAVDAGEDVEAGGRVIGADVAAVEAGGRVLRLVDRRDPAARKVEETLAAQGRKALLADPHEDDLAGRILAALKESR